MTSLKDKLIKKIEAAAYERRYSGDYADGAHLLLPQLLELAEALKEVDDFWCKHPGVRADELGERDFCCECRSWIYPKETNPAHEALQKLETWAEDTNGK